MTAYWVSAFCGKEDQTIKKSYLVNADGKDSKQYGLNTKIMQIYQDTDSGRVQDDRYPAKKMPFDEKGGSDVYNTQYTYGIWQVSRTERSLKRQSRTELIIWFLRQKAVVKQ